MTDSINMNANNLNLAAGYAQPDVRRMSTTMLLALFQKQLDTMDDTLQAKLDNQQASVGKEKALADIANIISKYEADYKKDDDGNQQTLKAMKDEVDKAISDYAASAGADPGMVQQMKDAAKNVDTWGQAAIDHNTKVNGSADGKSSDCYDVKTADVHAVGANFTNLADALKKDTELQMTDVQDLVSKRAQAIQLMTNMIQAINDSVKGIVGQIGK